MVFPHGIQSRSGISTFYWNLTWDGSGDGSNMKIMNVMIDGKGKGATLNQSIVVFSGRKVFLWFFLPEWMNLESGSRKSRKAECTWMMCKESRLVQESSMIHSIHSCSNDVVTQPKSGIKRWPFLRFLVQVPVPSQFFVGVDPFFDCTLSNFYHHLLDTHV